MSYSNEEIFGGINGGRWQSCTAQMEYRKMLALESIAASLAKLANPAYVIESPVEVQAAYEAKVAVAQQMAASIETNSAEHDEGVERQKAEVEPLIRRRRHKDGA